MKRIFAKILSAMLVMVMLLAVAPCGGFNSKAKAASIATFSLNLVSETNTEVKLSVNLESGTFNNATFEVTYSSNIRKCTSIVEGDVLLSYYNAYKMPYAFNPDTSLSSVASIIDMNNTGSYFVYTFEKKANKTITKDDFAITELDMGYKTTNNLPNSGHTHSYNSVVTAPTCTTRGFTTYTCECGDTYVSDYVKALGHTDGEWRITKPATYTETGTRTLYCATCKQAIRTEIISMLTPDEPISEDISVEIIEPVLLGQKALVNVTVGGSPSQIRFEYNGTTKSVYRDESIIEKFDGYEVWHTDLNVIRYSLEYKVHAKYGSTWSDNYAFFTLECENINATVIETAPTGGVATVEVKVSGSPIKIQLEYNDTTRTYNRYDAQIQQFDDYEIWSISVNVIGNEQQYKVHAKYGSVWSSIYAGFTIQAEKIVNEVYDAQVYDLTLNSRDVIRLTTDISTIGNPTYTVKYESSNPKVAAVDDNGNVTAGKQGKATITCTVTDSNGNTVTDECTVTVNYSFGQWLIRIFLFGWLWY